MRIICDACGREFTGPNALKQYQNHEAEHARQAIPPIYDDPYVREYEVLQRDYDDYSSCRLKNIRTGEVLVDGAVYNAISGTNIGDIDKLIGKKIRITSTAEIIG